MPIKMKKNEKNENYIYICLLINNYPTQHIIIMKKILLLLVFVFSFNANSQTYYSQNFNLGGLNSWTTADLNNDGLQWAVLNASSIDASFGNGSLMSFSYNDNTNSAVTPNNLVTSPVIDLTAVTAGNASLF